MSEGWDSGDTALKKSHAGGPVRYLSRNTRWWSETQVKLSVRERESLPGPSIMEAQRRTRPVCPKAVFLLQTEAVIDPQVWRVSSSSSSFVKRAVKCAKKCFD